jgi:bifunctional non-homologous end joining protein LigD
LTASVRSKRSNPRAAELGFIEFQRPIAVEKPPRGSGWLFEVKYDGYRAQAQIQKGQVRVYTRNGCDWTDRFRRIATAAEGLRVNSAIIDGEATVFGGTGLPDIQALERELGKPNSTKLLFHAFDLLHLDGEDLRSRPLVERKAMLKELLKDGPPAIVYVDHLEGEAAEVMDHACELGLEGIIAKRADAPYRSGESESWLKLKCDRMDTFPIVAFVEKLGANPRRIASLYIGRRDGDRLLYAGKVAMGFTTPMMRAVRERLDPLIVGRSPVSVHKEKPKATWVRPEVLAEVKFSGVTDAGVLREAVFKGLREDLMPPASSKAKPRRMARPGSEHGVPKENILQLLPDAVSPSKEELIAYWKKMAKPALVHLGRRPLKLVRHTRGATFYHRGKLPEIPPAVHRLTVQKREGGEGVRVWVDDLAGLLGLVEMDVVEVHPWNATVDDIERADRIVLDLDPGEGVEWQEVIDTALMLREILQGVGLDPWPKVTGGKGIHLMAPLESPIRHDKAREFAKQLAQGLASQHPKRYLVSAEPSARSGRIFLDYLRNGRGNTAVGAYSPRVRAGFPIAAPVTWAQVEKGIRPDAFTMASPPASRGGGRGRSKR